MKKIVICLLLFILVSCSAPKEISFYYSDDIKYQSEDVDKLYNSIRNLIDREEGTKCIYSKPEGKYISGFKIHFDINDKTEDYEIIETIGKINDKIYDPYNDEICEYIKYIRDYSFSILFPISFMNEKVIAITKEYIEKMYQFEVDCDELPFETYIIGDKNTTIKEIYKEVFNLEIDDDICIDDIYNQICDYHQEIGKEYIYKDLRIKCFVIYTGYKYYLVKKLDK